MTSPAESPTTDEDAAGSHRPLTLRECALQMALPAAAVCFAPVVLVTSSGVFTRVVWLYLLVCNIMTLSGAIRRWHRVRTGEQILVPTFDAVAPTRVPRWLAAPFLCVLTVVTLGFLAAVLTILRAGAPGELVVLLTCILVSVAAVNVLAWRRLVTTRPRRAAAVAPRGTHTDGSLSASTDTASLVPDTGHWWTETGVRNEVSEPLRQQIRPGAGDR